MTDCFFCHSFNSDSKFAEIEAIGEITTKGNLGIYCTNKIKILREISKEEVLRIVNVGKLNTGFCNSGIRNSGNWNTGNWNSGNSNAGNGNAGNYNTGDWNLGSWNLGNCNTGGGNTGGYNSGDKNAGSHNLGNLNSGDWNKTNYSSGCFNTEEPKILMFNKISNWTLQDWFASDAKKLLDRIKRTACEWIDEYYLTDKEKEQHPECKTTSGYLKEVDNTKSNQIWWDTLITSDKDIIKSLPNFDADIFKEITGIDTTI